MDASRTAGSFSRHRRTTQAAEYVACGCAGGDVEIRLELPRPQVNAADDPPADPALPLSRSSTFPTTGARSVRDLRPTLAKVQATCGDRFGLCGDRREAVRGAGADSTTSSHGRKLMMGIEHHQARSRRRAQHLPATRASHYGVTSVSRPRHVP